MHSKRWLPYEDIGNVWTDCNRHVEAAQIAAFREGVTCKQCLSLLEFREEWARERAARKENNDATK